MRVRYRGGRHRPNHIYVYEAGAEPSDEDEEIGTMFTDEAGVLVVQALNHFTGAQAQPVTLEATSAAERPLTRDRDALRLALEAEHVRQALKLMRSVACQLADRDSHRGCLGLRSSMNYGAGCLCECHDAEAAGQGVLL